MTTPSAARDRELSRLYTHFKGYVSAVAFQRTRDAEDVEDLVQDVFLAAIAEWERLRDPTRVRPWLRAITVHLACMRIRRRRLERRWMEPAREVLEEAPAPGPVDVQGAHVARLSSVRLGQTLAGMPASLRDAWVARALHGEALEDLARAQGCSLATVKRRVALADALVHEALG